MDPVILELSGQLQFVKDLKPDEIADLQQMLRKLSGLIARTKEGVYDIDPADIKPLFWREYVEKLHLFFRSLERLDAALLYQSLQSLSRDKVLNLPVSQREKVLRIQSEEMQRHYAEDPSWKVLGLGEFLEGRIVPMIKP